MQNKSTIHFSPEFLKARLNERCIVLKKQKLEAIETLKQNIEKYTKSGNAFKLSVSQKNLDDAYESLRMIEAQLV